MEKRQLRFAVPRQTFAALLVLLQLSALASVADARGEGRLVERRGRSSRGRVAREARPDVLRLPDRQRARLPEAQKRRAINKYGLKNLALRRDFVEKHNTDYAVTVPELKIRNQKASGRCWIFTEDRVLRSKVAQRGVDPDALSVSFINFHALRRRANTWLERSAGAAEVPRFDKDEFGSEGGFGDWAHDIVREHGIVPERSMPTTADGKKSGMVLNKLARVMTAAEREMRSVEGPSANERRTEIAERYKGRVERLLEQTIGKPPETFQYKGEQYDPQSFRDKVLQLTPEDLDYVALNNDPRHAWNRRLRYAEPAPGMPDIERYNVGMDNIYEALKKTLESGEGVYLATNVSSDNPHRFSSPEYDPKAKGIASLAAFDYDSYVPSPKLTKRERLKAGISPTNHAMTITGYQPGKRPGSVEKWRVDNSWGEKAGDKGRWHMYDDFMRQYGTTFIVPRKMVSEELLAELEAKPPVNVIERDSWTPRRREQLVMDLIAGQTTVEQAARQHGLERGTVERWRDDALSAMSRALGGRPDQRTTTGSSRFGDRD